MSVMPRRARASRKRGSARATSPTSVMSSIRMRGRTPGTCRQSTTLSATRSTRASQTWPLVRSKAQTNASRGNEAPARKSVTTLLSGSCRLTVSNIMPGPRSCAARTAADAWRISSGVRGSSGWPGAACVRVSALASGIWSSSRRHCHVQHRRAQQAPVPSWAAAPRTALSPRNYRAGGADLRKQRLDPLRGSASSAAACPFPSPSCPIRCLA